MGLSMNSRVTIVESRFARTLMITSSWYVSAMPSRLAWAFSGTVGSVLSCTGAVSSTESELATSGRPRVQRVPRSQRVHIISPMNDLSIGNGNDRHEPIVIRHARSQDLAVHLVFDDHNSAVVGMINDKLVG